MPYQVYVNIGSNQGDRRAHIGQAVALIAKLAVRGDLLISSIVETEPWGFVSDNRFMNIGVVFDTLFPPEELLKKLQEIECAISPCPHRDSDGNYIDRIIDIDIIVVDGMEFSSPELTLPHPRMYERDFVMRPMRELSQSASWLQSYLV